MKHVRKTEEKPHEDTWYRGKEKKKKKKKSTLVIYFNLKEDTPL